MRGGALVVPALNTQKTIEWSLNEDGITSLRTIL